MFVKLSHSHALFYAFLSKIRGWSCAITNLRTTLQVRVSLVMVVVVVAWQQHDCSGGGDSDRCDDSTSGKGSFGVDCGGTYSEGCNCDDDGVDSVSTVVTKSADGNDTQHNILSSRSNINNKAFVISL